MYRDDASLGNVGDTIKMATALPFLQRELDGIAPAGPWYYHRKGTPRRPRVFHSWTAMVW